MPISGSDEKGSQRFSTELMEEEEFFSFLVPALD
jgi:hypothetical protein